MEFNQQDKEVHSELTSLMFLQSIPGMGSVLLHRLWRRYGSFGAACRATVADLQLVPGIGKGLAIQIPNGNVATFSAKAAELLLGDSSVLLLSSPEQYPFRLLEIPNAPPLLFKKGLASLNASRVIGIVGTRQATARGLSFTRTLIEEMAPYNPLIVSGLALGIDGAAHKAALECGLQTAAVLGSGLDLHYPPEHRILQEQIAEKGALLSELMPGTRPERAYFPMRNRIVAGLCDAIILIEAADRGGALLTCAHANRYKRPVFALPGRPEDPWSQGPLQLLAKQEAKLFFRAEHISEALRWTREKPSGMASASPALPLLDPEETKALDILHKQGELHLNEWAERLEISVSNLSNLVLSLELNAYIVRLPGNRFGLAGKGALT